ncbi:alpha/beta hydrolase [Ramlibacter sp. CrO1]|uniref:Alpha/beta hydrolase n=1 Tax=Ramlibacter algicola TaxID=2795217 RepID=A0A934UQL1_9BURK|nr:alpha/beta hydrolase [Ramlibacter algicola]MBK0392769.1 alpha/beta hydrolase [Ramlibacter algicola]
MCPARRTRTWLAILAEAAHDRVVIRPHVREAGTGPTVVCLHSNASHAGQWRGLMDMLADAFRVMAVDSYGSGKTPDWSSATQITLEDEVQLIEPLLEGGVHLVGHSYGAAIAFKAALMHPALVRSLAVYEPTLFSLVDRDTSPPNGTEGIKSAVRSAADCLDRGDAEGAARAFIDFWMGPGSFDAMPAERRPAIVESCRNVRRWAHALMTEPATLDDLRPLRIPVLYMVGARSPESSRCVADRLVPALPNVRRVDLSKLGHMAPVTHPAPVNEQIAAFLRSL